MPKVKHGEAKDSIWKHCLVPVLPVPGSLLQRGTRSLGCPLPSAELEGAVLPAQAGGDNLPPPPPHPPTADKPAGEHLRGCSHDIKAPLFRAEEEGRI